MPSLSFIIMAWWRAKLRPKLVGV